MSLIIFTSPVFLAQPGKSPDISQTNSESDRGQQKLNLVIPAESYFFTFNHLDLYFRWFSFLVRC